MTSKYDCPDGLLGNLHSINLAMYESKQSDHTCVRGLRIQITVILRVILGKPNLNLINQNLIKHVSNCLSPLVLL